MKRYTHVQIIAFCIEMQTRMLMYVKIVLNQDGKFLKDQIIEILEKVVWYFPPIPRFRRMYGTRQISKDLICNSSEREVNNYIRHPADAAS